MALLKITQPIFNLVRPEGALRDYCIYLNELIKRFCVFHGKQGTNPGGTTHFYFDGALKCFYLDSNYGQDIFSLAVADGNAFRIVYSFFDTLDGPVINELHPGDWLEIMLATQQEYNL